MLPANPTQKNNHKTMKRPSLCSLFLFAGLLAACLLAVLAGWLALGLPDKAASTYGLPPAASLGAYQRIFLSARLLMQVNDLRTPYNPQDAGRSFTVQLGESTYEITERLQAQEFIPSAAALRDYLVYAGLDTGLQAGEYDLSARMTPLEIAHAIQDSTPGEVTFSVLPGWRLDEVAAALPTSGLSFAPQVFIALAQQPLITSPVLQELAPGASIEGFLLPDTYLLPRETPVDVFLGAMLENFHLKVDQVMRQGFQDQGLSLYQAVTLASIVERETIVDDEMPLIASVFLNRLAAGMKLDADSTVQYALGFQADRGAWWKNPLSLEDLQFASPYNTYLSPGLPPGPIANPTLAALSAVARPAQSPYYYFRAACDGSGRHVFAVTFEEHQNNACP